MTAAGIIDLFANSGRVKDLRTHGTPGAYRAGCRCHACVDNNTLRQKRRDLFGTVLTDADVVIPQIRRLLADGASKHSLASAIGSSHTTIRLLLNGKQGKVQQGTRDKILRLSKAPLTGFVPAIGSTRRVQALMAAKHSLSEITSASGLNHNVVSELLNGHRNTVRGTTAAAIRDAYAQLSGSDGTSVRAAARATRMGWAPPVAWDGRDIDDADAFPDWTGLCGTVKGFRRHQEQGIPACPPCETAQAAHRARKAGCAA